MKVKSSNGRPGAEPDAEMQSMPAPGGFYAQRSTSPKPPRVWSLAPRCSTPESSSASRCENRRTESIVVGSSSASRRRQRVQDRAFGIERSDVRPSKAGSTLCSAVRWCWWRSSRITARRQTRETTPAGYLRVTPEATGRRANRAKSLSSLMERIGIEPMTSWLQTRRSPS
jgi:hypothetical protein